MLTYVVYDQKTGKIVHVHNDTGDQRRKTDDVLKCVHPSLSHERLAVMAGQLAAGKSQRVNPKSKKIEVVKAGAYSAGSAVQQGADRRR
jgi:hypothetical protein